MMMNKKTLHRTTFYQVNLILFVEIQNAIVVYKRCVRILYYLPFSVNAQRDTLVRSASRPNYVALRRTYLTSISSADITNKLLELILISDITNKSIVTIRQEDYP